MAIRTIHRTALMPVLGATLVLLASTSRAQPPEVKDIPETIRRALATGGLDRQKAILTLIPEANLKGMDAITTGRILDDYLQKTTNEECKVLALVAYGKLNPPATPAAKVLKTYLTGQNVAVRRAAASALAHVMNAVCIEFGRPGLILVGSVESIGLATGGPTAVTWVRRWTTTLLNEEIAYVRFTEGCRQLLPLCGDALNDADDEVRASGAEGIRVVGTIIAETLPDPTIVTTEARTVDPFEAKLKWLLLQPALNALNKAAPPLRNGIASKREETRLRSARAVEALAMAHGQALSSRRAPPENLQAFVETVPPEDPLRSSVADLLPAIAEALRDESAETRLTAAEAFENFGPDGRPQLAAVIAASTNRDLFVRWVTTRALGRMFAGASADESKRIVAALAARVEDADLDVAVAALLALNKGGEAARPATEVVLRRTTGGDPETCILAIRTLEYISADRATVVNGFGPALAAESPRVRRAAVVYLGKAGSAARPAIPTIRKLLADPDDEVRKEAARAILQIEKEL